MRKKTTMTIPISTGMAVSVRLVIKPSIGEG
jgi:hypothetical protein